MVEDMIVLEGDGEKSHCCPGAYIPTCKSDGKSSWNRKTSIIIATISAVCVITVIGAVVGTINHGAGAVSVAPKVTTITGFVGVQSWHLSLYVIQEWNRYRDHDHPESVHQAVNYESMLCSDIKACMEHIFPNNSYSEDLYMMYQDCRIDNFTEEYSQDLPQLVAVYTLDMMAKGNWSDEDLLDYKRILGNNILVGMMDHNISGNPLFSNIHVDPTSISFVDDVDRCKDILCPDLHICVLTPWDYKCQCLSGYQKSAEDKDSCIDVDECRDVCTGKHDNCTNEPGTYSCVCEIGYHLVKLSKSRLCTDTDECVLHGSELCPHPWMCVNSPGSYHCICDPDHILANGTCKHKPCPSGFILQNDTCVDIDECASNGTLLCPPPQTCHNEEGAYHCLCPQSHHLVDGHCVHDQCAPGYQLIQDSCRDINECAEDVCPNDLQTCHNTPGSYRCLCVPGYTNSQNNYSLCLDVDECQVNYHICEDDNEECVNTVGSYNCICAPGYNRIHNDTRSPSCSDIDECGTEANDCTGDKVVCVNTAGSYHCQCTTGYVIRAGACTDIDECLHPYACTHGVCINTAGGYTCNCSQGFTPTHDHKGCTDIDECAQIGSDLCHDSPGPVCYNTIGSYRCGCPVDHSLLDGKCVHNKCRKGYHLVNDECQDVDECRASPCRPYETCTNTVGSYRCHDPHPCSWSHTKQKDGSCTECPSPYDKRCANYKCVNAAHWCRHSACGDHSDIKHCMITCKEHQTRCDWNLRCLAYNQWLDTRIDCSDKKDEVSLFGYYYDATTCMPGYHMCTDNKQCIHQTYTCDGHDDCKDGSDEDGCHSWPNKMTCLDGFRHFPRRKRCDGNKDCPDGLDEPSNCVCLDGQKKCTNGHCIEKEEWCNGVDECGDNSDESNCDLFCSGMFFKCDQATCIAHSMVCDGNIHCADLSDEISCDCHKPFRFQCKNGACIKSLFLCNGIDDCMDGSDELNCTNCEEEGNMLCSSNLRCIPKYTVCDGESDCPDGQDERNCSCGGHFQCYDKSCVDQIRVCDGIKDCADGDDELKCLHIQDAILDGGPNDQLSMVLLRHHGMWYPVCSDYATSQTGSHACDIAGQRTAKTVKFISISPDWARLTQSRGWIRITSDNLLDQTSLQIIDNCSSQKALFVECENTNLDIACGRRTERVDGGISAYMISGTDARPGMWPWQVALYHNGHFSCGGSILSSRWILTAAHCVESKHAADLNATNYKITVGATNLTKDNNSKIYQIAKVIQDNYISTLLLNDLALLQTVDAMEFTDYVRPVCLPEHGVHPTSQRQCYRTGWGLQSLFGAFPNTLQEERTQILPGHICSSYLAIHPDLGVKFNEDKMLCVDNTLGNSCYGDSGGPLVCKQSDGRWTLFGVTSWGSGKTACRTYDKYVNVSAYTQWISQHTGIIIN